MYTKLTKHWAVQLQGHVQRFTYCSTYLFPVGISRKLSHNSLFQIYYAKKSCTFSVFDHLLWVPRKLKKWVNSRYDKNKRRSSFTMQKPILNLFLRHTKFLNVQNWHFKFGYRNVSLTKLFFLIHNIFWSTSTVFQRFLILMTASTSCFCPWFCSWKNPIAWPNSCTIVPRKPPKPVVLTSAFKP